MQNLGEPSLHFEWSAPTNTFGEPIINYILSAFHPEYDGLMGYDDVGGPALTGSFSWSDDMTGLRNATAYIVAQTGRGSSAPASVCFNVRK